MRAEIRRICSVLGGFAVIGLVGAMLTFGPSSTWLLLFACWLVSLVAFIACVAYERIAYPKKPISAAELFHEVKAIQTAKAELAAWPQDRSHRLRDIALTSTASAGGLAPSSQPIFRFDPVPDQLRHVALEISDRAIETASGWQEDFVEQPLRQPQQGPSPHVE